MKRIPSRFTKARPVNSGIWLLFKVKRHPYHCMPIGEPWLADNTSLILFNFFPPHHLCMITKLGVYSYKLLSLAIGALRVNGLSCFLVKFQCIMDSNWEQYATHVTLREIIRMAKVTWGFSSGRFGDQLKMTTPKLGADKARDTSFQGNADKSQGQTKDRVNWVNWIQLEKK